MKKRMTKKDHKPRYFLGYLTANDDPEFTIDYLNIRNMLRHHPGVPAIHVCIAVSEVNKIREMDRRKVDKLRDRLLRSPYFADVTVIFKSNKGRDFSSAQQCLRYFSAFCSDTDYIMIQNRSGHGPLQKNWFSDYISQNKKLPDGGLTGNTINQGGHPLKKTEGITTHVQTYVYVSQWQYFKPLMDQYPGAACTERLDVIAQGEIGLSIAFLKAGLQLNCLYWPDYVFDKKNTRYTELPQKDIKKFTRDLPIKYKFRSYRYRFRSVLDALYWRLFWSITSKK